MFARFDENPAMTLQNIKETKRYGRTHGRTHGQRENSIPTTNKVCGGYKNLQKQAIFYLSIIRYVVHTVAEINNISNKAQVYYKHSNKYRVCK